MQLKVIGAVVAATIVCVMAIMGAITIADYGRELYKDASFLRSSRLYSESQARARAQQQAQQPKQ